jgi:hypothetical protein
MAEDDGVSITVGIGSEDDDPVVVSIAIVIVIFFFSFGVYLFLELCRLTEEAFFSSHYLNSARTFVLAGWFAVFYSIHVARIVIKRKKQRSEKDE